MFRLSHITILREFLVHTKVTTYVALMVWWKHVLLHVWWIWIVCCVLVSRTAHPVYKMWIIQEPNMLELWNKLHFEEKKMESIFIHSSVFSPRGRSGRNQSPVMEPIWLLALHPRQILGDSLPLLFPAFRGSHFRHHVPLRPQRRKRS